MYIQHLPYIEYFMNVEPACLILHSKRIGRTVLGVHSTLAVHTILNWQIGERPDPRHGRRAQSGDGRSVVADPQGPPTVAAPRVPRLRHARQRRRPLSGTEKKTMRFYDQLTQSWVHVSRKTRR